MHHMYDYIHACPLYSTSTTHYGSHGLPNEEETKTAKAGLHGF